MKKKHWVKVARKATTHEFEVAYGALRFITRECKDVLYDDTIIEWMALNNTRLATIMLANLEK